MSEKIVQLNEEVIKGQLKELVCGSVEETLNELLEQEAEKLTQAARYERSEVRQGYRSGRCYPLNFPIPRSMPSARMHSTASAARLTAASMAFLSSPANLPSTQSARA